MNAYNFPNTLVKQTEEYGNYLSVEKKNPDKNEKDCTIGYNFPNASKNRQKKTKIYI